MGACLESTDETREQAKVDTNMVHEQGWHLVRELALHRYGRSLSRLRCPHLLKLSVLNHAAFVCIDLVEQLLRLFLGEFAPGNNLGSFLPACRRGCAAATGISNNVLRKRG